jgi:hypothetical protein
VLSRDAVTICCRKRAYALRLKSEARTRSRNCFGVAGGVSVGGALAGFGFATAGAGVFAAFFAAVTAASRARCLVAKAFALEYGVAVDRRHFPATEHAERVRKRPALCHGDLVSGVDREPHVHHDALEFPSSQVVLLTRLCVGQHVTVLQLPAGAHPAEWTPHGEIASDVRCVAFVE